VALTGEDARRLGFDPQSLTYDVPVHTASGATHAARIHLASLSVGGARVEDVDAMVVNQGLTTSLLGMSYLGRLSRFEATPQALILRP
jgi:aspartyl protease family protein